ncbi:hypothetical protein CEXT_251751 [Caerostris extrusa]|uniref:Uncharacterized protein n=1 Tax=Caerostris extrusa TaxID=172846 RepID=A0AAV4QVP8_CAEEX|nr:hypothetical protein CEXT_251751 [Caerostris extrusa]
MRGILMPWHRNLLQNMLSDVNVIVLSSQMCAFNCHPWISPPKMIRWSSGDNSFYEIKNVLTGQHKINPFRLWLRIMCWIIMLYYKKGMDMTRNRKRVIMFRVSTMMLMSDAQKSMATNEVKCHRIISKSFILM